MDESAPGISFETVTWHIYPTMLMSSWEELVGLWCMTGRVLGLLIKLLGLLA